MKSTFIALLLVCTSSSVFADYARDGRRDDRRDPIRECQIGLEIARRDNQSLSAKLFECQTNRGNNERTERLERENADLRLQINNARSFSEEQRTQIERLKIDIARLELEVNPDRNGGFNLGQSIAACSRLDNVSYSQQCITLAKQNSIKANVIEQCARMTNVYYALECIKTVGTKEIGARQIDACLGIDNVVYAQKCIQLAADRKINSDIIKSCVRSTTNSYYQVECLKNM